MTLDEQRIERAAKALAAKRVELMNAPLARIYGYLARAAVSAYLGDDSVVVPKEPTTRQMEEAGKAVDGYIRKMANAGGVVDATDYALRAVVYRAMLSAAARGGE